MPPDENNNDSSGGLGSMGGNSSSSSLGGSGMGSVGDSKHTYSEERDKKKGVNGEDVANGINAGADALDSITGFYNAIMGNKNNANSNQNYNPPPPAGNKNSPLLIGGIVGVSFLIIVILILTKNGQSK